MSRWNSMPLTFTRGWQIETGILLKRCYNACQTVSSLSRSLVTTATTKKCYQRLTSSLEAREHLCCWRSTKKTTLSLTWSLMLVLLELRMSISVIFRTTRQARSMTTTLICALKSSGLLLVLKNRRINKPKSLFNLLSRMIKPYN